METKKYAHASLENYSKNFLLIGLALTLFCTYVAIEHKTYVRKVSELGNIVLTEDKEEETIITHRVEPVKPPPPPPPVVSSEIVQIVEDHEEIQETIIESTETDENDAVEAIRIDDIVEIHEAEEIIEDVPFAIIEDAPVFPGCTGNKNELKKCLSQNITLHVNNEFNSGLAGDLGLPNGKKRIFVMFTIDKQGIVSNIKARAPHPRLQSEAIRVIESLPKMTPGKQRGIPVSVQYSLPITFEVIPN